MDQILFIEISYCYFHTALNTDAPKVQRKETSKRAGAKKTLPSVSEISDDVNGIDISDDEFEPVVVAEKKKGGRKPAAAAKPPAAASKKRGPAAKQSQLIGQKLITEVLKPSENPGISPEKKVRKMRESPFNKKSGSMLGSSSSRVSGDSVSGSTEEISNFVVPRTSRPQRGNRTKATYVLSDSEEDDDASDPEEIIDSDFEDEDED